jgi:hypothetical protein
MLSVKHVHGVEAMSIPMMSMAQLRLRIFGIKKFKALTIVNDEARIERIIRKCPAVEPRLANPMFLFNTYEAVQKGNVLTIPWTDMTGNKVRIMS